MLRKKWKHGTSWRQVSARHETPLNLGVLYEPGMRVHVIHAHDCAPDTLGADGEVLALRGFGAIRVRLDDGREMNFPKRFLRIQKPPIPSQSLQEAYSGDGNDQEEQ